MIFLSPNVISFCQYVDQGFTETAQKKYQCILLQSLVEVIDEGRHMLANLKKVSLKDVVYWIA